MNEKTLNDFHHDTVHWITYLALLTVLLVLVVTYAWQWVAISTLAIAFAIVVPIFTFNYGIRYFILLNWHKLSPSTQLFVLEQMKAQSEKEK